MRFKYIRKEYSETAAAYMAGIIDGEGALTSGSYAKGNTGTPQYTTYLIISSTDECLIDWLVNTFGSKKYTYTRNQMATNCTKQVYKWQCTGELLMHVCEITLPYIIIKRRQIEIVMEMIKTSKLKFYKVGQRGPSVLPEVTALRVKLCSELRSLHARKGSFIN
jgi:hypothetical protein